MATFLGNFEKPHSNVKLLLLFFRQLLKTFGLLFTPICGHTGLITFRRYTQLAMPGLFFVCYFQTKYTY